ncbi:hypothetical protein D9M73_77730 [compost metagenome]
MTTPNTPGLDAEREAFESAAKNYGLDTSKERDHYVRTETVIAYRFWQARSQLATTAQAEPVEKVEITLDFKQATELLEMFGGEPCAITLIPGDGHSGKGLYAYWSGIPEEGALFLGVTDEEAQPASAPVVGGDAAEVDWKLAGVLIDAHQRARSQGHSTGTSNWAATLALAASKAKPADVPVALSVWYGKMPESNGRNNWTAILHRGDMSEGYTIDRSEYPDRVRYEADRVRFLIGETAEAPCILDYNADERTPCHLCGGKGEKNGKPCWGLNFKGTTHDDVPAPALSGVTDAEVESAFTNACRSRAYTVGADPKYQPKVSRPLLKEFVSLILASRALPGALPATWISVADNLPICENECTSSGTEISNTVLVYSPLQLGFGHLQDDGKWVIYEGDYDMAPTTVTHWMSIPKAPIIAATQSGVKG